MVISVFDLVLVFLVVLLVFCSLIVNIYYYKILVFIFFIFEIVCSYLFFNDNIEFKCVLLFFGIKLCCYFCICVGDMNSY